MVSATIHRSEEPLPMTSSIRRPLATAPTGGTAAMPKVGPGRARAALIVGVGVAIGAAIALGHPDPLLQADPPLARLLRGMALIKGALALAAVAVLLWRFGWPVSRRLAGVYLASAWLVAGSSMLIWQLTSIAGAATAFHVGGLALIVAAWCDGGIRWSWGRRDPARIAAPAPTAPAPGDPPAPATRGA